MVSVLSPTGPETDIYCFTKHYKELFPQSALYGSDSLTRKLIFDKLLN